MTMGEGWSDGHDRDKDAATDVPGGEKVSRHVSAAWEARRPIRISIDGAGELVVEDEESYEKLLHLVDRLECIAALKLSIEDSEAGRGRPFEEALADIRRQI